ncbi:ACT domain-containing protein [Candidatus Bathyarchaeota archaeon]|nr:ACT domain-containing protein [Candidatus Bathyarchaeota archaeon]
MITPSDDMIPVFAATELKLHPDEYSIVSLSVEDQGKALELFKPLDPFCSVTVDSDEVSLILKAGDWGILMDDFHDYEVEGPYRVITFDIVLDLGLVGYLSVVSAVLAEAGISIYAVSTYLRDHILVKSGDAPRAMQVLGELVERNSTTN